MRGLARGFHPQTNIRWEDDRLPGLSRVHRLGLTYDVVWLSAVWMHVAPAERPLAFRRLSTLLRPGGWMFISLREGSPAPDRLMYPVSTEEIERLAVSHDLSVRAVLSSRDALGRDEIAWKLVILELLDDSTGSLPTLRGIILQDAKSATYKLALLRALTIIADRSASFARDEGEGVLVPLGLLALYWVRMFRPLLLAGLPQAPSNIDGRGLGFVKEAFRA